MKSCVVLEVQSCSSHPLGHQEPTKLSTIIESNDGSEFNNQKPAKEQVVKEQQV